MYAVDDTAVGSDINALVFDSYIGGGVVGGSLYVGGDAKIANGRFGASFEDDVDRIDVVAKGALSMESSEVTHGSIVYGTHFTNTGNSLGVDNTATANPDFFDFVAAEEYYKNISTELSELPTTGTTKYKIDSQYSGALVFKSSMSDDRLYEVFSVDCSEMQLASHVQIEELAGRSDVTYIINVVGFNDGDICLVQPESFDYPDDEITKVIYNFVDVHTVSLLSSKFKGAILAPFSHVTAPTTTLFGQLVSKSITGTATIVVRKQMGCRPYWKKNVFATYFLEMAMEDYDETTFVQAFADTMTGTPVNLGVVVDQVSELNEWMAASLVFTRRTMFKRTNKTQEDPEAEPIVADFAGVEIAFSYEVATEEEAATDATAVGGAAFTASFLGALGTAGVTVPQMLVEESRYRQGPYVPPWSSSPSPSRTPSITPSPSASPSSSPSTSVSPTPSPSVSASPSVSPSVSPSASPSASPSSAAAEFF